MKAKIMRSVRPTRIELQKIRKRIVLSERGLELLQDKLDAMIREMTGMKAEYNALAEECMNHVKTAYPALTRAGMSMGWRNLTALASTSDEMKDVDMHTRNIMGRRVPEIEVPDRLRDSPLPGYTLSGTTSYVDSARAEFEELTLSYLRLAEAEGVIRSLNSEIKKTRRRVNALENVMIPSLNATAGYIESYLEELEREELFRRKWAKSALGGERRWR
jgi:V/A-type H+-transporting ATPase subunit D